MGEAGPGSTPDPILEHIEAESAAARKLYPHDPETGAVDIHQFATLLARAHADDGFTFTPEQVEGQLSQCGRLLDHYHETGYRATTSAAAVHAPAPDEQGSVLQTEGTLRFLTGLADTAANHFRFLAEWQRSLVEVKNAYLRNEHLTESQWQRLAGG